MNIGWGQLCILTLCVMLPQLWRVLMKYSGSDDNGFLTPSIMVFAVDQHRNDLEFRELYVKFCKDYFGYLDRTGDGYLSEDEYKRAFVGVGVKDVSFVHSAFEYMDVNEDGKLSIDEYTAGCLAYLTTEDAAVGTSRRLNCSSD